MRDDVILKSGFTLLEILLTMTLLGILSSIVGKTLLTEYIAVSNFNNISESSWNAYIGLERIVNDIHTLGLSSSISTMNPTQLTFTDLNNNSISFQLSGTTLLRNSITLSSGVQSLTFRYLNSAGATTTTASEVYYIAITMTAAQNNQSVTFSTMAATQGSL
jgi:prepilin-type N-terminal cleavage/methylation domain-containing protein